MGDVITFEAQKEEHLSGEAICSCCGYEWVAVAPVGVKQLECPQCKTMKGLFRNPVAPRSEYVWECGCGCRLFFISPDFNQCYQCGQIQNF